VPGAAVAAPKLDMTDFFSGRTHAENVLKIAMKRPEKLIVDSVGKKDGNSFILIDIVREGDKPVRTRRWVMKPAGPNRYTGTLSDATSPVDLRVTGNRVLIQYVMKGGLKVRQEMELQSDGRTLTNRVQVRKFGLKFASVEGRIRKVD
jgi:hypothetical protein